MQVYDDVSDNRFAGRFGEVVAVHEERDEVYPHGRVEVLLAIDRLYATFFMRPRGPNPVTFKPNDLDRSPE